MKIRISEFKSKLVIGADQLIDTYFSNSTIGDRLINATVKIIVKQNIDKMDNFVGLFADKDGFIDTDVIVKEYGKAFGADKIILDLRDFVDNDIVRRALPNKALAIRIDDVAKIFEET
jgi:hypothetical protein